MSDEFLTVTAAQREAPLCEKSAPVKTQKVPENGIAVGKCRITGVNPVTWRSILRQSQKFYRSFWDPCLKQHFPVVNVLAGPLPTFWKNCASSSARV
jgi:hypothetical protein